MANNKFANGIDEQKVESIKQSLKEGTFVVNSKQIAESIIAIDKKLAKKKRIPAEIS